MISPRYGRLLTVVSIFAVTILIGTLSAKGAAAAEKISFKEDIFPIIQTRCLSCHKPGGEGYEKSGLDLRTYESLMKGTKYGPMVIPGDAFSSNLIVLIYGRANAEIRMPFHRKELTPCDKNLIWSWVNRGAKNN